MYFNDLFSLLSQSLVGSTVPPLAVLNWMPKSPSGPPGLWLAVRIIPPIALIFLMTQDAAGVDMMPF